MTLLHSIRRFEFGRMWQSRAHGFYCLFVSRHDFMHQIWSQRYDCFTLCPKLVYLTTFFNCVDHERQIVEIFWIYNSAGIGCDLYKYFPGGTEEYYENLVSTTVIVAEIRKWDLRTWRGSANRSVATFVNYICGSFWLFETNDSEIPGK